MKKNSLILLLLSLVIIACEKDDFCTSPLGTPKLILRFYDNANKSSLKNVERLSVWAQEKDTLPNYKSVGTIDSIAIPLNTLAKKTVYNFKMNTVSGNKADNKYAKLTIKYTAKNVYISRSCGFRTIFNAVKITSNNVWFQSFTPSNLAKIDNEKKAHIKIYH